MRLGPRRACCWAALLALGSPDRASAADSAEAVAPAPTRQVVELSAVGALDAAQRAALVALLEPELRRVGLSLVWSAAPVTRERLARANADRQTLMLASLDVRDRDLWKLIVVDVQRRRAAERALPAPGRNAAAAEGVASIVASAAAALREGLEVASASADDVLNHSPVADVPASPSSPKDVETSSERTPAALQASPSLGGALATLAENAPVQLGIAASVGVTWSQTTTVRLGAAWYEPAHFASSFGSFRIERESLSLSAARRWALGAAGVEAALGVSGELLRRAEVEPGVAVDARGGSSVTRIGGFVLGRGSFALTHQIAIVAAAGAAWFPRHVQYVAAARETFELTAPWRLVGTGELEIELRVP
jgi:hypothetical protein